MSSSVVTTPAGQAPQIIAEVFTIGKAIRRQGGTPYLVGGWVRDMLMGNPSTEDYDLEVFGLSMEALQKVLAGMGPVHSVGRHFGVLKLHTRKAEYDVSVPRRESNIGKGHKGFWVKTDPGMSFEEAASRRDFTINAMGYDFLADELLDPHGGREDLRAGILRHVSPAFAEDPLRVLRAMRFAGRFGFSIAGETLALCRTLELGELPRERLWEEIRKLLLQAPRPSEGFCHARDLGVLDFFPELASPPDDSPGAPPGAADGERVETAWRLTLAFVDQAAAVRTGAEAEDTVLMTAAMCFGMAGGWNDPPGQALERVEAFLRRLTNETRLLERVGRLVAALPRPQALYAAREAGGEDGQEGGADAAVRRLALEISIPFLLRAAGARHRALHGQAPFPAGAWLEERARALGVWDGPPTPLLQGRDLLEHGLKPGPALGRVLQAMFQQQLDGALNTREEALQWVLAQPAEEQERGSGAKRGGRANQRGNRS